MTARSRLPLRYLGDGLTLTDDAAWAWFRVPTVSYAFLSEGERESLLAGTAIALSALSGSECHLLVVPDRYPATVWADSLDADTRSPAPAWPGYLDALVRHLGDSEFWQRQVFLGVLLGRRASRRGATQAVYRVAGLDDPTVQTRELEQWREEIDALGQALATSTLRATPASADELAWLVRRAFWRSIPHVPSKEQRSRAWGRGALESLAESVIRNGYRSLVVEQPEGRAHVAFLAAARFPDIMTHPGAEWLYHCDTVGFPVEASVRFKLVPPGQASVDASKKLAEASDQARHIAGTSSELPLALLEATEQARQLEYAVTKEGLPLVYGWTRFAVAAPTAAELASRCRALIETYRDLGVDLALPSGDQLALFMETLPGDRVRVRAYEQRQALVTLAGSMFMATADLGDRRGPYIGETTGRTRGPVHFDPLVAAQRNLPTAIAITGAPGGGKTHLAELLLYQLAARGAWGLMVDPKNEAGGMADLAGLPGVRVLRLGPQHEGLLDPYSVAADGNEEALLAAEVLRLLLPPGLTPEHESLILRAAREEADAEQPFLGGVVGRLADAGPAGEQLAEMVSAVGRLPLARLCFGRPTGDRLDVDDRLLILQLEGVAFPDAAVAPADYTITDRLAVTVMYLVTTLASRLADAAREQAKAIVLDEAWALTGSRQGRALVQRLARTGRSKNLALVLVSQNAADFLGPEIQNNFSARFAFRSTQEDEVLAVLRLLGVEATPEHVRAVRTLENGECVFADLDGRVGTVRIDLVLPELLAAFDTTPPTQRRSREPVP